MTARVLMVQGTASHVGKSVLVAAFCRIFRNAGLKVAPFKAQNMSLNSFVTPDGGEIGRAQAVQAEAAGIPPSVEMNPILLKPEANSRSQVVVMGRPEMVASAAEYYTLKEKLWPVATSALDKLRSANDVVVIEGAGSPAEVNLRDREIVNMRVARYCSAPVLLVGDIDRGGVFASLLGTLWLLENEERALVKGLVINKFRGDKALLEPGLKFLEAKAGIPVVGVIPYFRDISIANEDSVALDELNTDKKGAHLDIAVIRLPHISNFDDFDPLAAQPGVRLRYVESVENMGDPALLILPGTKTTMADLEWLEGRGLGDLVRGFHGRGGFVIGICGGYQMLGKAIEDPDGVESQTPSRPGLGLLPVTAVFARTKSTHQVRGMVLANRGLLDGAAGLAVEGYEIHMGRTGAGSEGAFRIGRRSGKRCDSLDGCLDETGRVLGTYLHGLFQNEGLRRAILTTVARARGCQITFEASQKSRDAEYDRLAELVEQNVDMGLVWGVVGLPS